MMVDVVVVRRGVKIRWDGMLSQHGPHHTLSGRRSAVPACPATAPGGRSKVETLIEFSRVGENVKSYVVSA